MVIVVSATFLAKTDFFFVFFFVVKTVSTKSSEKCSRRPETGVREYVS